jgi:hypothetical protein
LKSKLNNYRQREFIFGSFLLIIFFIIPSPDTAQINIDSVFKLKNAVIVFRGDGKEFTGFVSQKKDSSVVLVKGKDSTEIRFSEMKRALIADENNYLRGRYVNANIFSPFNLTFATAFPVPRKTVLIRTTWFGIGAAHIGLPGSFCASYFTGVYGMPVGANLRSSIKFDPHLYVAPEAGIVSGSWILPKIWMWNAGARATQGNSQKNITIGGGYMELRGMKEYVNPLKNKYRSVYINFGMQQRISKKISIMAEAWYIQRPKLIAAGIFTRHHRKENSVWSFGALLLYLKINAEELYLPVPMIQWNTKF